MRGQFVKLTLAAVAVMAMTAAGASEVSAQVICTNTCASAFDMECDDGGPGSLYNICGYGTDCNDCGARPMAQVAPAIPMGYLCMNTCSSSNDMECDDGGPGSLYNICGYGTDCNDCGARPPMAAPVPAPMPAVPMGYLCMNSCSSAFDMECDDGGPGSMYNICGYGTDCNDCGARPPMAAPVPVPAPMPAIPPGYLCMNTCASAMDMECDDGGPGSLYNVCGYGTDCNDCGARPPMAAPVPAPMPAIPPGYLCMNNCSSAFDMECDDGGPGSLYNICGYGTDCNDCGARPPMAAPVPAPMPAIPPGYICMNTCSSAMDMECDDGGPGSLYNICGYGTDCNDCGARPPMAAPPVPTICTNTCASAFDMECDDGGPGSLYNICAYGTDCNDCGPRAAY